jgi:Ig-like domain from next to BRCA1 gene
MKAAWRIRLNWKAVCTPAHRAGAPLLLFLGTLFLGLGLGGCSVPQKLPPQAVITQLLATQVGTPTLPVLELTPSPTIFRLASPSPIPTTTAAPRAPTSTPSCQDGLRYLSDITVPDGSIVAPGEAIDKQWQVENSGTCNWNERYRLRRISGPSLDASEEQALYPARGGTQAVIRVMLLAPPDPGTYRSAWQAYNPQGEPFGDPIYVEILVGSGSP